MAHPRILLADDSRAVRDSVVEVLSELPNGVTSVENGAQALKLACTGNYGLLISDIEMPIMNGFQLLRLLRSQFFSSVELPIVMLTQVGEAEHKVRAFADGANDYVTKPVEPQELMARVRAQLELRELHRENMANQAFSLHAQKLAAVAQLSATLAHELNTPAQYLGDNLVFLSESYVEIDAFLRARGVGEVPDRVANLHEEIPTCLRDMHEGVARISRIVQTMVEFAEPNPQRVKTVELAHSINTVVDLLRSHWLGIVELATHHSPHIHTVRCGPADLKHALWQLIAQAIDDASSGTDTQGRVDIVTELEYDRAVIRVRAARTVPKPAALEQAAAAAQEDALRLTRDVLQRYEGELTKENTPDATTWLLRLPI
jgi:CheY-like chemotaxis protein